MGELTATQQRAVVALLGNKTIDAAATQTGISERTLRRWMADDTFAAALRSAETDLLQSAVRQLAGTQAQAVTVLQEALKAPKPADRIKAASALLSFTIQLRQAYTLEQRLGALEQRLLGRSDDASI